MENLILVQNFEALHRLNEYFPYVFFLEPRLLLLVPRNLLEQVSMVTVFHHDASSKVIRGSGTYQRDWDASSINAS